MGTLARQLRMPFAANHGNIAAILASRRPWTEELRINLKTAVDHRAVDFRSGCSTY
jgi:hypothetical protein